jgi:hypothetical protein
VSHEEKSVTRAVKNGVVPLRSVFNAVRSLDDDDVSVELAMKTVAEAVRPEDVPDGYEAVATLTVDVAMKTVASVPAPRGSPTKSLDAVGMFVALAVLSLEVEVVSLALAAKSIDLAMRDVSIAYALGQRPGPVPLRHAAASSARVFTRSAALTRRSDAATAAGVIPSM